MIDMHHDLLSIIYNCYIKNDYSYLEEWLKNFRDDNVSGLIANLYFMNEEEMKKEIGDKEINVIEMFKLSSFLFKKLLPDTKVVFSIEGCDYVDINDLDELYKLGLRNILLVWNNPNKYGSGNRGDYGLTDLGKAFLIKAIDLGICIDLSHMNRKTFSDTIKLISEQKELGKDVKVIASHSNCYDVYNHERNLDDEQLRLLKSVDGILGLIAFSEFTSETDYKDNYLKHILHAIDIMSIDNVGISSDDMDFCDKLFGDKYIMNFDYKNIKNELFELLSKEFISDEIELILYENINKKLFI